MTHQLTTSQSYGSFFELALRRGYESGDITREKVDQILRDAPKGIIQIAGVFEAPHLRSGVERGMMRMVALVSLYLEYTSRGDLNKAIALIREKSILELSKGGSEMIKALYPFFTDAHYIDIPTSQKALYDDFKTPVPPHIAQGLSRKYISQRKTLKDQYDEAQFIKAFLKEYPQAEMLGDILSVYAYVVTGRLIESEQIEAILAGNYDTLRWERVRQSFQSRFPELMERFTVKYTHDFYLFINGCMNKDSPFSDPDGRKDIWVNFWSLSRHATRQGIITSVFTATYLSGLSESIKRSELLKILKDAYANQSSLAEVLKFAERFTPDEERVGDLIRESLSLAWDDMLQAPEPPKRVPKSIAQHFRLK